MDPAQSLLQKHSSKKATDVISVYKQMTTALGEYLATGVVVMVVYETAACHN